MKSFRNSKVSIFITVLVFAISFAATAFADNAGAKKYYDEYVKCYTEFKSAVDRNLDQATIGALGEKYKAAYEKYQKAVDPKQAGAITGADTANGTAAGTSATSAAAGASEQNTAASAVSFDSVVKLLHSPGAVYKADELIAKLTKIANDSRDAVEKMNARVELANAYSKFKKDNDRAASILEQAIKEFKAGGSGPAAEGAQKALARAKFEQYKTALAGMIAVYRKDAAEMKKACDQISWTKPLTKLKAMAAYTGKLFDYRKAITIYKSYKENGEKKEGYVSYQFLTDLIGQRPAFGVVDTYDNAVLDTDDDNARIRLITDNVESWYARWWAISNARSSIDITYFIIKDDAFGKSLFGLLIKKAREGVKIRLMIDDRGDMKSTVLPVGLDYLQELAREPNIDVRLFNSFLDSAIPSILRGVKNVVASNHQKIIVVDGVICITGGRNIAVEYLASPLDEPPTIFRDTDVLIKSARVAEELRASFEYEFEGVEVCKKVQKDAFGNWVSRERELLKSAESMESWISGRGPVADKSLKAVNKELATYKHMTGYESYEPFAGSSGAPVKIFSKSGYQQEKDEVTDNIIAFIEASSDEVIIQNPYVVLTEKAKAAIKRASARGVRVIIHTNSPASDNQIMSQAFFLDEDWMQFMKDAPNARIYVFTDKMTLHAKVFVFDRAVSVVGTYNMDYLSEQINCENVCAVNSVAFSRDCRERIMQDIAISKEYRIGLDSDGKPYEIFGPGNFLKGTKKTMIEYIQKLKMLRPLI